MDSHWSYSILLTTIVRIAINELIIKNVSTSTKIPRNMFIVVII